MAHKNNIVLYGNCHTGIIQKCLKYSKSVIDKYNIQQIYIVDFLETGNIDVESAEKLKKADIFICQYIEKDRGDLNHNYLIQKYIKEDCKVIFFPHFRFDCYLLEQKIYNCVKTSLHYVPLIPIELFNLYINNDKTNFYNNFDNIYNNITIIEEAKINMLLNTEIEKLKKINEFSTIDMYDYVMNNYKKDRLFGMYNYPSEKFFYELVKRILELNNIFDIDKYNEANDCIYNEWNNTLYPIVPNVYNILKLEDKTLYNKLTIKNYYSNITSLKEYYYKIITLFYENNKYFNIEKENNKILINNTLGIKYYIDYKFINNNNYLIQYNKDYITLEQTLNNNRENDSFGLIIPNQLNNIHLIDNNINIKIDVSIFDSEDNKILTFDFFDGNVWNKNIRFNTIFTIYNSSSKPRIKWHESHKFIKIKNVEVYYYI